MAFLNRNTGFILGNVIGLSILVAGIVITAPQKMAEQEELDKQNTQAVVVAVCDLAAQTKITTDNVKADRRPHDDVPLNAVLAAKKIFGLTTKSLIKKGQVVTYSLLNLQSKSE